ncbi:MAG: hypothetical protein RIC14_08895 [Filomicrobium sp.]
MRPIASEIRGFEVVDIIAFSRFEKSGNIKSLVYSAAEQFFRPGVFEVHDAGEVRILWGSVPEVEFNMSFRAEDMTVYFRLMLSGSTGGVEIDYIDCEAVDVNSSQLPVYLNSALSEARIITAASN